MAEAFAVVAGAVGGGLTEGLGEELWGQLVAEGFQNGQFTGVRQVMRLFGGVGEVAGGANVAAEEQVLVEELEVEQAGNGFADAGVLEDGAACVEGEDLKADREFVGEFGFEDEAVGDGGKVVSGHPLLGDVLLAVIGLTGLEGLEGNGRILVVFDVDAVVIELAAAGGSVAGPPIVPAGIGDAVAEVELFDAVGAGAEGWFGQGAGKVAGFPPVLGEHREAADGEREVAVEVVLEVEDDSTLTAGFDARDVCVGDAEGGAAFFKEGVEGPEHVFGQDGRVVSKAGFGAELEAEGEAVRGEGDGLGEVGVAGGDFVGRAGQEGFPDVAARAAGRRATDAWCPLGAEADRGVAFEDVGVEAVEAADTGEGDISALGRVRVYVGEVRKVRRQGGGPQNGEGVGWGRCLLGQSRRCQE